MSKTETAIRLGLFNDGNAYDWKPEIDHNLLISGHSGIASENFITSLTLNLHKNSERVWVALGRDGEYNFPKQLQENPVERLAASVDDIVQLILDAHRLMGERYRAISNTGETESGGPKRVIVFVTQYGVLKDRLRQSSAAQTLKLSYRELLKALEDVANYGRSAGIHLVVQDERPSDFAHGSLGDCFRRRVAFGPMAPNRALTFFHQAAAEIHSRHMANRGQAFGVDQKGQLVTFQPVGPSEAAEVSCEEAGVQR